MRKDLKCRRSLESTLRFPIPSRQSGCLAPLRLSDASSNSLQGVVGLRSRQTIPRLLY